MSPENRRGAESGRTGRYSAEPRQPAPPDFPTAVMPAVREPIATGRPGYDPSTMAAMTGAPGPYPAPQASLAKKPTSTSKQILLVTVPAVVALVVGVWFGGVFGPSVFGGSGEPDVAPLTTDTVAPPGPSPSPPVEDEPAPGPLGEPVTSTSGCAQGYVWSSATIARTHYDSALVCSFVSDRPSVDYMVPAGATTFTATVGLDDSSAETKTAIRFDVVNVASGKSLWHKNVKYGDSVEVDANIDGVLRVRLEISRARGKGATDAVAVWADPKMF